MAKIFTPKQGNWRFYQDDGAEPTTAYANENTTFRNDLTTKPIYRIRITIAETGGAAGTLTDLKIQYSRDRTTFIDMGSGNHWNWANGQGTNGDAVTTNKLTDTAGKGIYDEDGTPDPTMLASTSYEYDFAIQATASAVLSPYWFRLMYGTTAITLPDTSKTYPAFNLIETLTDNFDDNSVDTGKWTLETGGLETNNQIEITCPANVADTLSLDAVNKYSLIDSSISVKIVDVGNTAKTSYLFRPIYLYADGTNYLRWYIVYSSGVTKIRAYHNVGGSGSDLTNSNYDADTYRYVRIRESGGTTYWEYSSNGSTWSEEFSEANPITLTSLNIFITFGFGKSADVTTVKFDNFNILPSGVLTGVTFMES